MKRIISLIAIILISIIMAVGAFAEQENTDNAASEFKAFHDAEASRVVDEAELFSDGEKENLTRQIKAMTDRFRVDFVIATVKDTDGKEHMEFSDDFFDYHGYGIGENYDGILLLICMNPNHRGWWISTSGSCLDYFTIDDTDKIGERMTDSLTEAKYFAAANVFLSLCTQKYELGKIPAAMEDIIITVVIILIVSLLFGLILASILKACMKTVRTAHTATNYLVPGSFSLGKKSDMFLYRTVTKTAIPKSNTNGSHTSSSGRSHGGSGGSF